MCGIIGYTGEKSALPILLEGLRSLEYRGYDSAGVATLGPEGTVQVRRCAGKIENLERLLGERPVTGTMGIGHTRWATHGRPSEANAHPHKAGAVVLIHNGIIENYLELRRELLRRGRKIASETDTEVICHLIDEEMQAGRCLFEATKSATGKLRGSFALVVLSEKEPGRLVAAKNATPIVIGLGEGENFVASDIPALLSHTRSVLFLEDGELAEITKSDVRVTKFNGEPVHREPRRITWDPLTAQKGGYKHFLLKEIFEQPRAILDTLRGRIGGDEQAGITLPECDQAPWLQQVRRVYLVACGTAWHACLVGKYYLEGISRLAAEVDYGSEFRYRDPVMEEGTIMVVVSQSGETADTLAAVEAARERGVPVLAICNVVDSSIARKSDVVLYTRAGPEISVASTKAFTTQITLLYLLALHLGVRRGVVGRQAEKRLLAEIAGLPKLVERTLEGEAEIKRLARRYAGADDFLYLGRGLNYPIALEGALKLKEISYIHAEGYPAGEMKHGPIALVNEALPVVVLIPRDAVYEKVLSNMKEVESRGGRILAITDAPNADLEETAEAIVEVPRADPYLLPILNTVPLQLLAYHVAVHRGTDVDQPRNLAKSVTVE